MKKLYSKKLGTEAYALAPEQLDIFRKNGYKTPTPAEVIADAAVVIEPPEGKRVYVVFNCKEGVFSVRARTATLTSPEVGEFVGEVVGAALLCRFLENADPDRPKAAADAPESPFIKMLKDAFAKAAPGGTSSAAETPPAPGKEAEDTPEVVE